MDYGICNLSIVSLRSQPENRSELISQVLFGEHFKRKRTNVVVYKYKYRAQVELNDQSADSAEKGGVLDKKQSKSRAFMSKTPIKGATLLKWGEL